MIVQFGGQTPLNLALAAAGGRACRSSGTSPGLHRPGRGPRALRQAAATSSRFPAPDWGTARSLEEARERRPADRLPGAGAAVLRARRPGDVHHARRRRRWPRPCARAVEASPEHPVLLDQFLEDAFEVDVDALADGERRGHRRASCSTSRRPGSTPATRPACCRRSTRSWRSSSDLLRDYTRRLALALGRARPDERAVRDQGRRGLRARGQPARQPHGALRVQGDRACRWPSSPRKVMVGRDAARSSG